jgi:hypothetical protein
MANERLPIEPLRRAVERRGGLAQLGAGKHGDTALRQAYHRGLRQGYLSLVAADQLAVRLLGAHPIELWGDAWLVGTDGVRACLAEPGTVGAGETYAHTGRTNGSAA